MQQKKKGSMLCIWIAIFGFSFTAFAFYDFNPKLLLTEITEELTEDGGDNGEEDGDVLINFEPFFTANKFQFTENIFCLGPVFCNKQYDTLNGFMLDMIKPPLN